MSKKLLLTTLTAAALALAAPAMASATDVPDLPTNVDQAYLADVDGNPENGSFTLSGRLTMVNSVTISCDHHLTIDFFDDGTSAVDSFTLTNCVIFGFPGCTATWTATNLDWGDRFGYDTTAGAFKDYIDISTDVTIGSGCPVTGTFPWHGILSPTVSVTAGTITYTFSGSSSGSIISPIGQETWTGTLTGSVGADTQLIHD